MEKETICRKRKVSIIRTIINFDTFDTNFLVEHTGYSLVEVKIAIKDYLNKDFVVYPSLSIQNLYYFYEKSTEKELKLWIKDATIIRCDFWLSRELMEVLRSFGFKQ